MHHHLNSDHHHHIRMKHNPKSYESFDHRKSTIASQAMNVTTTTTATTNNTSSSSSKKSLRGSIRRTLSLQPDTAFDSNGNCTCATHVGKEYISKIFNLNINYMFECLFEKSDFDSRLSQMTKKFGNSFSTT